MRPRAAAAFAAALLGGCGARSELHVEPLVPERLACGLAPVLARAGRGVELVAAVPPRLAGRIAWTLAGGPTGTASVRPVGVDRARFFTEVEGDYRVRVETEASVLPMERCEIEVAVRGTAPGATCPETLSGEASTPLDLQATVRSAAPLARGRWSIEAAPVASARPAVAAIDLRAGRFVPDVVGAYIARYEVVDAQGERDVCATRVEASAGPGLRVELWWSPPGRTCLSAEGAACDRSDLDLHLLRLPATAGWGSEDDCHFANCNGVAGAALAWGGPSPDDDPRLLRDDVTGHGPEVAVVTDASRLRVRVGVHYFAAHGAGAQEATVAVYCDGARGLFGPTRLDADAPRGGAFVRFAEVERDGAACVIRDARAPAVAWEDARGRVAP